MSFRSDRLASFGEGRSGGGKERDRRNTRQDEEREIEKKGYSTLLDFTSVAEPTQLRQLGLARHIHTHSQILQVKQTTTE